MALSDYLQTGDIPPTSSLRQSREEERKAISLLYHVPVEGVKVLADTHHDYQCFYGQPLFSVEALICGTRKKVFVKDGWEGAQLEGLGYELLRQFGAQDTPYLVGLVPSGNPKDINRYSEGTILVEGCTGEEIEMCGYRPLWKTRTIMPMRLAGLCNS